MSALPPAARAFCTAFNCSTPFVLPPMATVTGAELASAVFKVGGVGLIGAGHQPLEYLKKDVEAAREILKLGEEDELPLGVGLLTFLWEPAFLSSLSLSAEQATALGDSFLRYVLFVARFKYFWLSFSGTGAEGLGDWVERVRRMEREGFNSGTEGEKERKERVKLFVTVQTEEMGKKAREWDVDAVVAQGTEAGGHGPKEDVGLPALKLFSRLKTLYPSTSTPFLLVAGGLSSSSSVAEAFSLGAAAVVSGTALCVADESLLPAGQKDLLVAASGDDATVKGTMHDVPRDGRNIWPASYVDGRGLRSETTREAEEGRSDAELAERYQQAVEENDLSRIVTWAGTGVGDVHSLRPAKDILVELMSEVKA